MAKRTELIIIDPQVDFCEPATGIGDPNRGSLCVDNADQDMIRLAAMIRKMGDRISQIHVTLDSHHLFDVAHPLFWINSKGDHPKWFTVITASDVANGVWIPVIVQKTQKMIDYTRKLEEGGRYPLCIWPPHCLIGSKGQMVYPPLFEALLEWETPRPRVINYVTKGSNIWTEHYSAVKAEVPDPEDPSTQLNTDFIDPLEEADIIYLAGEAGSHCLANTGRDIVKGFSDESFIKKIILLEDATSPVKGYEQLQTDFISEMAEKGMQVATTTDF
ncbi:hypothetical protein LCGC14_2671730 [marine sediment metagenome]|uniref:Isochorismatase-like domain-containing protein n=1 Tax=marine sediment metagenome TaxID=412755 RepID=A0A0F8ZNX3_9ZZZZ